MKSAAAFRKIFLRQGVTSPALRGAGDANGGGAYVAPINGRKSRRLPATPGTRLFASFGCVFAQFLQKPQQCQPFVF